MPTNKPIIALAADVSIAAAAADDKGPRKFTAEFYTGGALDIEGWEHPVVVDLAGLESSKVLVANLDHDRTKRVGNFAVANDGKSLVANGTASARTPARDEVVGSAEDGYQWQASLEVNPKEVESIKKGQQAQANGQTFEGPLYITRTGTLKGFAFVSHGADDNTTASIAATAASNKEQKMKAEVQAWVESFGLVAADLTDEQVANFEANYEGKNGKKAKAEKKSPGSPFEDRKIEAKRIAEINAIAENMIERRGRMISEREVIEFEKMAQHAIENDMTPSDFRNELYEATLTVGQPIRGGIKGDGQKLTNRVLEAAICQAGNLAETDRKGKPHFTDQELQVAHDHFKGNISLRQFLLLAAQANGHQAGYSQDVDREVLAAGFAKKYGNPTIKAAGFSTIDVDSITAATANKFMLEGWMAVDQTPLRIAAVRNVKDFKTATTVSLTGAAQYTQVGAAGEIKHATLGEKTYTYHADTYAAMLAITRQDIINDDLGALTAVPKRLGRGAMLKLNDLFWTVFLAFETNNFTVSGNNNLNAGVADMTIGGLNASLAMFMNQTDPDGKPLALMPKIIVVPPALWGSAAALMDATSNVITGASVTISDVNVFKGMFRVETSPYMANSSYTGYDPAKWYMLADPNEMPAIVIAALNGRVEPTVETADADFNTLGIQMRGYSDVGVSEFEFRAVVKNDGGSS